MSDIPFSCQYCDEYIPKGCALSFDNHLFCSGSHKDAFIRKTIQSLQQQLSEAEAARDEMLKELEGGADFARHLINRLDCATTEEDHHCLCIMDSVIAKHSPLTAKDKA